MQAVTPSSSKDNRRPNTGHHLIFGSLNVVGDQGRVLELAQVMNDDWQRFRDGPHFEV